MRLFADGLSSWLVRHLDAPGEWMVFDRPSGSERDLVVITDEVYEHLTYGAEHVPIATLPGMAERTLTLSSAGKSYSFTGWKVGWATGPADLVGAVLAAKQWLTFTNAAPLQPAVLGLFRCSIMRHQVR